MLQTHYWEILKSLERLKEDTMQRMLEMDSQTADEGMKFENSLAKTTPLSINGYPVFQFSYDGMLPLYKENDREYLRIIRDYYYRVTLGSYDFSLIETPFKHAALVILHYFTDNRIRDLDNRNRKVIIDAIRHTALIADDSWKELSIVEEGHRDKENHIQVYLLERDHLINFLSHLKGNHFNMKQMQKAELREVMLEQLKKEKGKENEQEKGEEEMNKISDLWR
ncbi:RusA family crossover junction endodeoxyribonuclease [Oceanobacillus damuensis]|uniref:hypothetical protein n=1 Tax=Oceanobacillus damuensis TaxID=937928 RepID=UPI00082E2C1B|nr:hypothetical protein [Oceanobacillus damuensis]